jgi:pyruvate formate lyase activating enzyme
MRSPTPTTTRSVFAEYAIDTALACRAQGIRNVAVTAGYIHPEPAPRILRGDGRRQRRPQGLHRNFYHKLCVAHLQPVLDTLAYIHHETDCWLEITTLLIPGHNDSPAEINELATWVMPANSARMCRCISPPSTPTGR